MPNIISDAALAALTRVQPQLGPPPAGTWQSKLSLTWSEPDGSIALVRFDVVTNETHEGLMTITDHPVEVGANVADNAHEVPKTLTVEAYVTNVPASWNPVIGTSMRQQSKPLNIPSVPLKPSLASVTNAIGGAINNAIHPSSNAALVEMAVGTFPPSRPALVWEALDHARQQRRLINVITALESIPSMLITRLAAPRTVGDGTGISFQVNLQQIKLVYARSVVAPQPAEARGQVTVAAGSKSTQPADPETDARAQSILVQQGESFGLLDESGASS